MASLAKTMLLGLLGLAIALIAQVVLRRDSPTTSEVSQPYTCPPLSEAAALERFAGLISFPTVSNASSEDHVNDQKVFRDMVAYLARSYPRVWRRLKVEHVGRVGENELSLLITWTGSRPELPAVLFVSHYDVVPVTPGSEGEWTHPPFSGKIADGYVWGRGSLDIKFGVAGLLQAASVLLGGEGEEDVEEDVAVFRPERTLMFAFGHDEEVSGSHGAATIASLLRSRGVELDVVVDEGGAILEDGLRPFTSRAVAMVGTAEKGYTTVEVTLRAPGGHSSMPTTDGSDIAAQLWRLLGAVRRSTTPTRLQAPVTDMLTHVAPYTSGWMRLLLSGAERGGPIKWLLAQVFRRLGGRETAAMVANTLALTRVRGGVADNVLPQEAVLSFNGRLLPGSTPGELVEALKAAVKVAGVAAEVAEVKRIWECSVEKLFLAAATSGIWQF
ncbi:hypothetical protein VOLCADRAFT_88484 [Volvox carteri f. nagariensis]|uniref:Uncharacterized protein n=1 Tax=Volvox carteri f. nagariensis TaxID=3068 RepID=D8TP44_VOLCA|nr:uncharacterized protein VOLCADRAFT_88484 [Volvox carteri f. nagariensis]EFJ50696.1 hypothetical protein VOLCADRAFT_88484 [Volvox carteri f. nagariensis]|eukprot:XP_002948289.1 hypothetical protein VOLCADRAFT_88484 [Volvox carteri f. nagariensis]